MNNKALAVIGTVVAVVFIVVGVIADHYVTEYDTPMGSIGMVGAMLGYVVTHAKVSWRNDDES